MEIDFGLRFVHKLVVVRLAPVERNGASKKRVGAWDNQDINSSGETEFFFGFKADVSTRKTAAGQVQA